MKPSVMDLGHLKGAEAEALDERLTNYIAIMGFTIIVYDHLLTYSDEVRYIWSKPRGLVVYLFFLNRYLTPLSFIGNLVAYHSNWSEDHCNSFVRYEGAWIIVAVEVAALMMLVRVRALYKDNPKIVWLVGGFLLLETGVNAWLMTNAEAVSHEYVVHSCTMIFDPDLGFWPSFSAWLPLLYDTICIFLTLWRCVGPLRDHAAGVIVKTLAKDGAIYYSVIFCVNLVLAIMIMVAPPAIKNITAQLEQLLTVTMMSRITLNLKKQAAKDNNVNADLASRKTQSKMTFWRQPTNNNTLYSPPESCAVTRPHSPMDFASFGGLLSPLDLTRANNTPARSPPILSPAITPTHSRSPSRRVSRRSVRFSAVVTVLGGNDNRTVLDVEDDEEHGGGDDTTSAESADKSYEDDGKRVSLLDLVPL